MVKVFVYGTLMHKPGCTGWAREAELAPPQDATVPGLLLDFGAFPYADFNADTDTVIHGQVLTMDEDHPGYRSMCAVEIGAGYESREVVAQLSTGQAVVCIGWQIEDRTKRWLDGRLRPVRHGDWSQCVVQRMMRPPIL